MQASATCRRGPWAKGVFSTEWVKLRLHPRRLLTTVQKGGGIRLYLRRGRSLHGGDAPFCLVLVKRARLDGEVGAKRGTGRGLKLDLIVMPAEFDVRLPVGAVVLLRHDPTRIVVVDQLLVPQRLELLLGTGIGVVSRQAGRGGTGAVQSPAAACGENKSDTQTGGDPDSDSQ